MRKTSIVSVVILLSMTALSLSQYSCHETMNPGIDSVAAVKTLSHGELVARGKYIVTAAACSDCHSPKIFTPAGPVPDSSRSLSGHPAGAPALAIDKKVLTPGNWALISADLTEFVGPWGISYAANLTADTATGIGAWTEDTFVKTLKTGKHLGQEGGRPLLPPMPWSSIAQYSDEDLKAIYTYLEALPPISNRVPAPVSPPQLAKMK